MTELILGGLIYHFQSIPNIKQTSFQRNAILKFDKINVLTGNNSIGKPIIGLGYDLKLSRYANLKIGGYYQDSKGFEARGVSAPSFMPVVGLEINIPVYRGVFLNQFISPIITFTGIGIKF